jgi:hypothetical protein
LIKGSGVLPVTQLPGGLDGAILAEQYDEWAVCRRHMTLETLAQISHPDEPPLTADRG